MEESGGRPRKTLAQAEHDRWRRQLNAKYRGLWTLQDHRLEQALSYIAELEEEVLALRSLPRAKSSNSRLA